MKQTTVLFEFYRKVILFENGKGLRVPTSSYSTKNNRKRLTAAFSDDSPCVGVFTSETSGEYLLMSDASRALLVSREQLSLKTTRTSAGTQVFQLKKGQRVISAESYDPQGRKLLKESRYRKQHLPATGAVFEDFDGELSQQTLL